MPLQSPRPRLAIPDHDFWTMFYENPQRPYGDDHVLYIDGDTGENLTYERHRADAMAFGRGLISVESWSWAKGDVLMIISEDNIHSTSVLSGTLYAGGTIASGNPFAPVEVLSTLMKLSKIKFVVAGPESIDKAKESMAKAGLPESSLVVLSDESIAGVRSWKAMMDKSERTIERPSIDPKKDPAFVIYTSGTTGTPKCCLKTHYTTCWEALWGTSDYEKYAETCPKQVCVLQFPYWMGATYIVRGKCLYGGMALLTMKKASMHKVLEMAEKFKATELCVTPKVINSLANDHELRKYDLSSVHSSYVFGDVIAVETAYALWEKYQIALRNIYGLSESSVISSTRFLRPGEPGFGSCGYLCDNVTARVVDTAGNEVPEGCLGRLLIKSPVMATRFLNNPVLERSLSVNDGYMDTDDLAMIVDGALYVHGRIGEQIYYENKIIRSVEIERVLNAHRKVHESLVKGVPGPKGPIADPKAFIVLMPGVHPTEELKKEFEFVVSSQMEMPFWLRGGVSFVDSFPRSAADKVYRSLLK